METEIIKPTDHEKRSFDPDIHATKNGLPVLNKKNQLTMKRGNPAFIRARLIKEGKADKAAKYYPESKAIQGRATEEPVKPPEPVHQEPPIETPAPEPVKEASAPEPSEFPPLREIAPTISENGPEPEATAGQETTPPRAKGFEFPIIETAVDGLWAISEKLGGVPAPKDPEVPFSTLELRNMMVDSAKAVFPNGKVDMGPKTACAASFVAFFAVQMQQTGFRKNIGPVSLTLSQKIGLSAKALLKKIKSLFKSKPKSPAPAPEPLPEKEEKEPGTDA